jgi:dienelactone hydrolase
MTSGATLVRSIWESTRVEGAVAPYDTAHLRVYYPAVNTDTLEVRMSGIMDADTAAAPYPVVVFLSGVNIGQDVYRWLMVRLVEAGFVAVTFDYVSEQMPGFYGTSPGLDLGAIRPDTWGTRPPSIAVQPVLDKLAALNAEGVLRGLLDLDRVVLAGHSGGGTAALQTARTEYFPQLKACFAYAAHTVPADVLGFPEGTVLEAAPGLPVLIMSGTEDGIMAASAVRYHEDERTRVDPIERTFTDGVQGGRDDAWYVEWEGANHFGAGYPSDPTSARGFLDREPTTDPQETRDALASVVVSFCRTYLTDDPIAIEAMDKLQMDPPHTVRRVLRR